MNCGDGGEDEDHFFLLLLVLYRSLGFNFAEMRHEKKVWRTGDLSLIGPNAISQKRASLLCWLDWQRMLRYMEYREKEIDSRTYGGTCSDPAVVIRWVDQVVHNILFYTALLQKNSMQSKSLTLVGQFLDFCMVLCFLYTS